MQIGMSQMICIKVLRFFCVELRLRSTLLLFCRWAQKLVFVLDLSAEMFRLAFFVQVLLCREIMAIESLKELNDFVRYFAFQAFGFR